MNRRKQQQYNRTADHYSDDEIRRLQMTTISTKRSSDTHFEDIANETIYEIFDFLDVYHAYEAFSNLNIRFQNLLDGSTLPININMSFLSKTNFQRYYTQFVLPNIYRISSLRLLNSLMVDSVFSSVENTENFIGLKTVILDNIISQDLFHRLTYLPNLSSLIINQTSGTAATEYIYCHSIVCLPTLKYCKIFCKEKISFESPSNTLNESNSMEHLVINNEFDLNEIPKLLSCFPRLHRLSFDDLFFFPRFGMQTSSKLLNILTHVSLKLKLIKFNRFEPFIIHLFHNLQVFRISTDNDKEYLNAKRWERLISSHMMYLRIFDIQHTYSVRDNNDQLTYEDSIKQFTSSFWVKRQWYFGYQHPEGNRPQYGIFYSIQPYRRRYFSLYGKHNQDRPVVGDYHLVRHVNIQNQLAINDCSLFFSNANELTISDNYHKSHYWNTSILNRIIPLEGLHKIMINSNRLNFATLEEILSSTPNCYQLILNSLSSDETHPPSILHNSTFRSIPNANKITDITIKSKCNLKQIKLLVNLCSYLQHLTISVLHKELAPTIKYLLSNLNKCTRHLATLYIQSTEDIYVEKLMNLLEPLKQSDEFAVQEISYRRFHIWW